MLDLYWLLHDSQLTNLRCVAGQTRLSNRIASVNVLENSDVLHWMMQDELILTTGYCILHDEAAQVQLVRDLAKAGCAALCFKVNRFFTQVPPCMIAAAEELHFPILEIPFYCRFSEILQAVYTRLEQDKQAHATEQVQLLQTLSDEYFDGAPTGGMLRTLSGAYRCALLLTDPNFQLLAYALPQAEGPAAVLLDIPLLTPHLAGSDFTAHINVETHVFRALPLSGSMGYLLYPAAITAEETIHGLTKGGSLLALALRRDSETLRGAQSARFIDFLISEQSKTEEEIALLCSLYGFRTDRKRVCIAVQLSESLRESDLRATQNVTQAVDDALRGEDAAYFLCSKSDYVFVFLYFTADYENMPAVMEALRTAQFLAQTLQTAFPGEPFRFGIGRCHASLSSIREALWDSLHELRLCASIAPDTRISSYMEHLSQHVLSRLDYAALDKLYHDTVYVLSEAYAQNGTELIRTLQVYFQCGFHNADTAKALFLHRNTLFHRLERIKELLGMDFSKPNELFALYDGLCAMELLRSR